MPDMAVADGVRKSCKVAAAVMRSVVRSVVAGATTADINAVAATEMSYLGVRSAFLGYHGFPHPICVSINDEILHGMASPTKKIAGGDVVKLDLGVVVDGFYSDMAQTIVIDDGSESAAAGRKLSNATLSALMAGIAAARVGNQVVAITMAIESSLKRSGFMPVLEMTGHGVGLRLHELPEIPNALQKDELFRKDRKEVALVRGMTLAIEPMAGMGEPRVVIAPDGWTILMADGMPSAHWEHTVMITDGDPEVLTL